MTSKYASKKTTEDPNSGEVEGTETAKWNDSNTKAFLKACIEEVHAGNRPHSHFTKEGWKNLIKKFNERTGNNYVHKQLKNRWDALKKEFSLWAKLVQNQTGLGWDPAKRTIEAPEEFWIAKGKENTKYLKWKDEGPKFLDLLETCFKNVVATGYAVFIPYQDPPVNNGDTNGPTLEGDGDTDDALNDAPNVTSSSARNKRKWGGGEGEKRGAVREKLQNSLDRLLVGIDQMSQTTVIGPIPNDRYSIDRCLSLLNDVPGLVKGSSRYFLASRILAKKHNREAFVHFMENDPKLTLGWLNTFKDEDVDRC